MISARYKKVAAAVFSDMFKWSLWFFSILFTIHLVRVFWLNGSTNQIEGFFIFAQYSVNIFMLVVGIMAAYVFLSRHIQQGISRRDSYIGTALAATGLALFATLVPLIVNGLQHVLAETISLPVELDTASAFETTGGWVAAAISLFLNALTFFLAGWLISIGYYRFGWIAGFAFIALSFVVFGLNDYLWKPTSDMVGWMTYHPLEVDFWLTALGSSTMILVLFSLMRLLTKRVPIKM